MAYFDGEPAHLKDYKLDPRCHEKGFILKNNRCIKDPLYFKLLKEYEYEQIAKQQEKIRQLSEKQAAEVALQLKLKREKETHIMMKAAEIGIIGTGTLSFLYLLYRIFFGKPAE